ncbi:MULTISPECIES: CaiB/BaiF CoA-transferase family protein [Bosea]|uniref:Acyl-CoA transferase n=1 Tax=Bosea vaviloviae TaxID=1526658 RepID=A0A0N1FJK0_9HYPH|nr:CoA transferase [Bosea vaviloviae]KPH81807.1 acyl-CoA transferase [Bosea vaviloviae]
MLDRRIFEGVRVLDLTRVMSGPFCTAMMADLGAEIIKIELPGSGEEGRFFAPHVAGESTYFAMLNRGKKSVTVNMKSPDGIALIRDIAKTADVLVENFRPGVMERLGLGHAALQAQNSRLIYASISGFGQEGPYRDWPAFDLVVQAMSGLMHITGERDGRPTAVGESLADVTTGMFAAFGVASALYDREKTGTGRRVEVAMLDSLFSMLITALSRKLYTDKPVRRVGNRHPETYPVDSFATRDGDIVIVGFTDGLYRKICTVIGRPDLSADPRLATNIGRNAHEEELRSAIAQWAAGLGRDEAVAALRREDVTAAPVWSFEELLDSGHVEARGLVREGVNTKLGTIPLVGQPVRFHGAPGPDGPQRSPMVGEHTDEVLADILCLTSERIAALRAARAI